MLCAMSDDLDPTLREFLIVLRRALLMIVSWIEKRCGVGHGAG